MYVVENAALERHTFASAIFEARPRQVTPVKKKQSEIETCMIEPNLAAAQVDPSLGEEAVPLGYSHHRCTCLLHEKFADDLLSV